MHGDMLQNTDSTLYFYCGNTATNVALLSPSLPRSSPRYQHHLSFNNITPSASDVEGVKVFKHEDTCYEMRSKMAMMILFVVWHMTGQRRIWDRFPGSAWF